MATQYKTTNRLVGGKQTFVKTFTGDVADGNATLVFDLPPGAYRLGAAVQTAANNHGVTVKTHGYVVPAQTTMAGAMSMLEVQESTNTITAITLTATSTTRGRQLMVHATRAAVPAAEVVMLAYGAQFTVTTTAASGSGSWTITAMATEV